jgi:hypothetical protein
MLQKLAFPLSCRRLASDDHNSNKTARKKPFPATVETSQRLSGSYGFWPSIAPVRGSKVAVVQYYFLTLDLHAISKSRFRKSRARTIRRTGSMTDVALARQKRSLRRLKRDGAGPLLLSWNSR